MAALDFPNAPTVNQSFSGPNGAFSWDGVKWVPSPSSGLFVPEAPSDGKTYGRKNAAWNSIDAMVAPAFNDIGRNVLHNGLFRVQQRGQGPWSSGAGYTADRWVMGRNNSTASFALTAFTDAQRAQIGDEAAVSMLDALFTGTSGASDYVNLAQPIEGVRRLSGKTVIASFWANASAALKLGVTLTQVFGTGGSPSAAQSMAGVSVSIPGTAFARYAVTFAIPSTAGMTLGTNGDDQTQLEFWYSAGSNFVTRSGNVGVQSGTVNLWGVQLEVAQPGQTQPSPLDKPDIRYETSNAQRFYQWIALVQNGFANNTATIVGASQMPAATMRATPTITAGPSNNVNIGGITASWYNGTVQAYGTPITAGGGYSLAMTFALSADL